jgi:hypothetical protein
MDQLMRIRRRVTAAALITFASAVLAPEGLAKIEVARIGRSTDGCTRDGTNGSTRCRVAGRSADCRASACTDQSATDRTIAGVGSACTEQQARRKHGPQSNIPEHLHHSNVGPSRRAPRASHR